MHLYIAARVLMHECVAEPWAEQPQGARLCSPPRPPRWDSPAVRSCYSVRSLFCGSWVHGPQTVSQRCELAAPAVISLIRRMLTTGELARREASSSDPERLVAFSRHNHLACDQSSRFWTPPQARPGAHGSFFVHGSLGMRGTLVSACLPACLCVCMSVCMSLSLSLLLPA